VNYRTLIIKVMTFLGGIYFFLEFVLPEFIFGFELGKNHDQITRGFIVVGVMALGLGIINLLMVHGSKIGMKRKGWINSLALLSGLFLMMFFTTQEWFATLEDGRDIRRIATLRDFSRVIEQDYSANISDAEHVAFRNNLLVEDLVPLLDVLDQEFAVLQPEIVENGDEAEVTRFESYLQIGRRSIQESRENVTLLPLSVDAVALEINANIALYESLVEVAQARREVLGILHSRSTARLTYNLFFQGLFVSLGSAMFSLLGFYIAAAAYRAFRIKSMESTLMMLAAFIVMLGQIPFGVWFWEALPDIRLWILEVPNAAVARAIKIGAAIAGLVMAFRMWLSIESESFTERKNEPKR